MKNKHSDGLTLTISAPKKIHSGDLVVSGSMCGVAVNDAESGAECVLSLGGGVYEFPISEGASKVAGSPVYLTSAAGGVGHAGTEFTFTAAGNTLVGYTASPATSSTRVIRVHVRNMLDVKG